VLWPIVSLKKPSTLDEEPMFELARKPLTSELQSHLQLLKSSSTATFVRSD
jgi:hypothetical protein